MFNRNTHLHGIYPNMVCQCAQCQQARNAPTAILPRLDRHSITCQCAQCQQARNAPTTILPRVSTPAPKEGPVIFEIVTAINAETGRKVTYYWPIQQRY